jgi:hypothetical protein
MPVQTGGRKSSKKRSRSVSRKRKTTKHKTVKHKTVKRKTVSKVSHKKPVKLNRWQRFLKKHGGKGHSQRQLRALYRKEYR